MSDFQEAQTFFEGNPGAARAVLGEGLPKGMAPISTHSSAFSHEEIRWPTPPEPEAFHGLAGAIVRAIEPHSEADPVALLGQALTCYGNAVGRTAWFDAGGDAHYMNLNLNLVGATGDGRKGNSLNQVKGPFRIADPEWLESCVQTGLSSGEGLIWAVRDPIHGREAIREGGRVVDYQLVTQDEGVADKRLLIVETEFSSPLKVMNREGNTLSPTLRDAWDSGELRLLTKNKPAKATGAHISVIGHITGEELRRHLDTTEMGNGFANRFIWLCVRRSKFLPDGQRLPDAKLAPLADRLREALEFGKTVGEMKRDDQARLTWHALYRNLSTGKPGLLGSVISRAAPQVVRLSCIYALMDLSGVVRHEHIEAASAFWEYAEASAQFIFRNALGDPAADKLLETLRNTPGGVRRTEISGLFGRNRSSHAINQMLGTLLERGLARREMEQTGGRDAERWFSV